MRARLLLRERKELEEGGFIDLILWKVPSRATGRPHGYKYRLAYERDGRCVLRYDNETGKGDHRHIGSREEPYTFTTIDALLKDFMRDVRALGRRA